MGAALPDPVHMQLEQQLLISKLPTGIRNWHQMLFDSSRQCWHAWKEQRSRRKCGTQSGACMATAAALQGLVAGA